jgi:hypothetical protein
MQLKVMQVLLEPEPHHFGGSRTSDLTLSTYAMRLIFSPTLQLIQIFEVGGKFLKCWFNFVSTVDIVQMKRSQVRGRMEILRFRNNNSFPFIKISRECKMLQ